jgi:hypothetical protein
MLGQLQKLSQVHFAITGKSERMGTLFR